MMAYVPHDLYTHLAYLMNLLRSNQYVLVSTAESPLPHLSLRQSVSSLCCRVPAEH